MPAPVVYKHWRFVLSGLCVWVIAVTVAGGFYIFSLNHSNEQTRLAVNASVCGFRNLATPALARAEHAVLDGKTSPGTRKRAAEQIKSLSAFLATQVTSPRRFDCNQLKRQP